MEQTLKQQIYQAEAIYDKLVVTLMKDSQILPENKEAVKRYLSDKAAEGVTTVRLNIIFAGLLRIVRLSQKPLAAFTEQDVRELVGLLEKRNLSQWTKNLTKTVLKGILRNLGKEEAIFGWIKNKTPPNKLRPEDLLSEEEMSRMVAATDSLMWKAMLSILFECGPRPGELLNLSIKDVRKNGIKYKLYVRGKLEKTLGERVIYVYKSMAQLEQWLSIHPAKTNPDSPMWLSEDRKIPISLSVFSVVYGKISHRARIERRNWPYLARHTRLTQFYRDLGGVIGAKLAGHVLGSKEIRTYTHLSEADVERALDAANGIKDALPLEEPLKCPKCGLQNSYGRIFCSGCNAALGAAGALVQEDENKLQAKALEDFASNPKLMEILRKLAENPEMIEKIT
ncbi:MAG: site-specific integrase [Candidatus Woesearchaeota archaeon]